MKDLLRVLGCGILGGTLLGFGSVIACGMLTTTPKFCGLMFFYAAPLGCSLGVLVGVYLSLRSKPRTPPD